MPDAPPPEGRVVWLECAIVVEPEEGFTAPSPAPSPRLRPRPLLIDESLVTIGPEAP